MGTAEIVPGFGFWNRMLAQGSVHSLEVVLNRGEVLSLEQVLGSYKKQQQHLETPQQQQRLRDLQQLLDWWPWLLAAQEELQQAAWQLFVQRLLLNPAEVSSRILLMMFRSGFYVVLSNWWPWLLGAEEELQQASWQLFMQRILMHIIADSRIYGCFFQG
jgi:hypothetical protein